MTIILQVNKHGLLPMIRVREQCPTCLCLTEVKGMIKKHKKILILGIIVLTFAIHTLFYDSFTKYNGTPRKWVEQYLEERYEKKFS